MIARPIATATATVLLFTGLFAAGRSNATTFAFNAAPFAGTAALTTPGRQVIGNELFIPVFDFAADTLALNAVVFGVSPPIDVFNGNAASLPADPPRVIVLRDFDADNDPGNGILLNAGLAANLIAAQPITAGAGFFVYFNSGLDLPRLVFSTDLSSSDADLKILARFTGLTGSNGRDAMALFGDANFAAVPEPASWAMLIAGFGLIGALRRRQYRAVLA